MKAINIRNLKKEYAGGTLALNGINLDIEEGDYFALLGPNGAGKTTLIGILTSLVRKTSGLVKIFDYNIDNDFFSAKSCIGVVPQEFNFNIFETVWTIVVDQAGFYGVPRKIAKTRAEKYLKQLDLWDKRNTQARFLSGGMKKRLMIVRALIHQPRLLILDEPTAGVDVELRYSMWRFLNGINQEGVTIILTTHYLEEAESQCRNIAIINHGVIVENTNMEQLLQRIEAEHLILTLVKPIKEIPSLENCHCYMPNPLTLEIEFPKKITISSIIKQLQQQNIEVANIRNKSNRLERLFMQITQKRA